VVRRLQPRRSTPQALSFRAGLARSPLHQAGRYLPRQVASAVALGTAVAVSGRRPGPCTARLPPGTPPAARAPFRRLLASAFFSAPSPPSPPPALSAPELTVVVGRSAGANAVQTGPLQGSRFAAPTAAAGFGVDLRESPRAGGQKVARRRSELG
jgi:hypothetical protein